MNYVVLAHEHDEDAGVYRLVVGVPVEDEGETTHHSVEEFVFADDDPQWSDEADEKIAGMQRSRVAQALKRRGQQDEAPKEARSLPGAGEEL